MPEWPKGEACKALIHRFESDRHLFLKKLSYNLIRKPLPLDREILLVYLVAIFILLIFSGLFSAAETAYTSLSFVQLKKLSKSPSQGKRIEILTSHPENLISTILIMNNVINILLTTLTTIATIQLLGESWLSLTTAILIILLLILGEISPKQLALTYNENVALFTATPLYILMKVLGPLIYILSLFGNFLGKLLRGKRDKKMTLEELLQITSIAENIGILQKEEKSVFHSMIRSANMTISSIITHRKDIISFDINEKADKIFKILLEGKFDYFPLWKDNPENIIGILYLHDLMKASLEGIDLSLCTLKDFSHKPIFIPSSKKVKDLFYIFSTLEAPMLVCLDEFGGLSGILTKDNLLREILGELYDPEEKTEVNISKQQDNLYEIKGETPLYDFEEFFQVSLNSQAQTIGGYLLEIMDKLPHHQESISTPLGTFVINDIKKHRILSLFFTPTSQK